MQSYTILNEMLASLAMRYYPEQNNFSEGEKNRDIADVFRPMVMKNLEDLHYSKPKHNEIKQITTFSNILECENYTSQSDTTRTCLDFLKKNAQ